MSFSLLSSALCEQCGVCNLSVALMSFTKEEEEEEDEIDNPGTVCRVCLRNSIKMVKVPFY